MAWDPLDALGAHQRSQLDAFRTELLRFNQRHNLISRETEADFEERHLVHSLALTRKPFPEGSTVVDWGTGGGLPAIPLAIAFPEVTVHAVDAVGKKVQAVRAVARRLGLENLHPWHGRAEAWPGTTVYSVSRATAPLVDLWRWHRRACSTPSAPPAPAAWRPGLICLKGGDLTEEIAALREEGGDLRVEVTPLEPLLGRSYFRDKKIVEVVDF